MDSVQWRPLRGVDARRLKDARLQAHDAVQWLARAARAYIPPQRDDGHTSLQWKDGLDGFITQPFADGARLSLQINTLTLALHDGAEATRIRSLSLAGRSDTQARGWLGKQLTLRSLDAQALDAPSPYQIPESAVARGASYEFTGSADALMELAAWYANAAFLLGRVQVQMIGRKLAAQPVRCWPHHFDLATLTMLPMRNPDTAGYIGVGFSPGDEYYDEPYFYVSVYPEPDRAALPMLPAMGHWHTHDFTAGVKPAHKILAAKEAKDMAAETDEFLQGTVAVALGIVAAAF